MHIINITFAIKFIQGNSIRQKHSGLNRGIEYMHFPCPWREIASLPITATLSLGCKF